MSESFCQLCGGRFPIGELTDAVCPLCQEIQNRPKAARPVLGADDLSFTGVDNSSSFRFIILIGFAVLLFLGVAYWPRKQAIDLTGLKEVTVAEIVEDLNESESGPDFVGQLERDSQRKIVEELLLIEGHLKNPVFLEKLIAKERYFYRFSVSQTSSGLFEIRATPSSLFGRHYLMQEGKNIYYSNEGPASFKDFQIMRPSKSKQRKLKKPVEAVDE